MAGTGSGRSPISTGRCLCGGVRYEVRGPLQRLLLCHCVECRRWHGHAAAMVRCRKGDLVVHDERNLRWVQSPQSDARARRGFCRQCGSSLFWQAGESDTISISAGTFDGSTGLRVAGHWYTSQAGDYYLLPDDGAPRHPRGGDDETRSSSSSP